MSLLNKFRSFKNDSAPHLFRVLYIRLKNLFPLFDYKVGSLQRQYPPRPLELKRSPKSRKMACQDLKISIVTPSYNQGRFIVQTAGSILNQEYENLEYIIQDGNSSDNTSEVIASLKGLYDYEFNSIPDSGQANAINIGFQNFSGEIMAWVNSDDLLLPESLNTVACYFKDNPEIDVVYGNRILIDENSLEIGRWVLPSHEDQILSWVDYVPQETLFWRRSIWNKVGSHLDESFNFALDWDLLLRFRDAGARFARIPRFLGAFRVHDAQKTSSTISTTGAIEIDRLLQRVHGRIPEDKEIRKHMMRYLRRQKLEEFKYFFSS